MDAFVRDVPAPASASVAARCARASGMHPRAFVLDRGVATTVVTSGSSSLRALRTFREMAAALVVADIPLPNEPRVSLPTVDADRNPATFPVEHVAVSPAVATRAGPTGVYAEATTPSGGWTASVRLVSCSVDGERRWTVEVDGRPSPSDVPVVEALDGSVAAATGRVLAGEDGTSLLSWSWAVRIEGHVLVRCTEEPGRARVIVLCSGDRETRSVATARAVATAGASRRRVSATFDAACGFRYVPDPPGTGWGVSATARDVDGLVAARRVHPPTMLAIDRTTTFDPARLGRARVELLETLAIPLRSRGGTTFGSGRGDVVGTFMATVVDVDGGAEHTMAFENALAFVRRDGRMLVRVAVCLRPSDDDLVNDGWTLVWRAGGEPSCVPGNSGGPYGWAEAVGVSGSDPVLRAAAEIEACVRKYASFRWWAPADGEGGGGDFPWPPVQ